VNVSGDLFYKLGALQSKEAGRFADTLRFLAGTKWHQPHPSILDASMLKGIRGVAPVRNAALALALAHTGAAGIHAGHTAVQAVKPIYQTYESLTPPQQRTVLRGAGFVGRELAESAVPEFLHPDNSAAGIAKRKMIRALAAEGARAGIHSINDTGPAGKAWLTPYDMAINRAVGATTDGLKYVAGPPAWDRVQTTATEALRMATGGQKEMASRILAAAKAPETQQKAVSYALPAAAAAGAALIR
jgi:hypothetical protein